MTLTVLGVAPSPFVRKVRVFLAEKGAEYSLENVNIFPVPDWFAEISPLKRIPVLRDESRPAPNTIADSSAICLYAERAFPEPSLYPADPFECGRAAWFEEYADTELANAIGMGVFRPVALAVLMGKEPDRAAAEKTMSDRLSVMFDYLEREISGRDFLASDAVSIADIAVATQFVNLRHAGFAPDAKKYPQLTDYLARMHSRPSFATVIAEEAPLFARTAI